MRDSQKSLDKGHGIARACYQEVVHEYVHYHWLKNGEQRNALHHLLKNPRVSKKSQEEVKGRCTSAEELTIKATYGRDALLDFRL